MDLQSALKTLQESMGSFTYPVYIPSYKETKEFRLMTTGDVMSIGKKSKITNGFDYQITLFALIKKLSVEEIDIYKLTDFDRMRILLSIFMNNNNDIGNVTFECKDELCKKDIKYKIDLHTMISKIENPKDIVKDYNIGNLKINMTYGSPTYLDSLCFYKELEEQLKYTKDDKEARKNTENEFKKRLPLLYIKKVIFNGEEIDFINASEEIKKEFLSIIPNYIYDDIDDILSKNSFEIETKVRDSIVCECGEKMEVEIDLEDFFR